VFKQLQYSELTPLYQKITRFIHGENRQKLAQMLSRWLSKDSLTLPHPTISGVSATAIYSQQYRKTNVIYFHSGAPGSDFALIQIYNFIDALWVSGAWYYFPQEDYTLAKSRNIARRIESGDLNDKTQPRRNQLALLIGHYRPAHFFYDQLPGLLELVKNRDELHYREGELFFPLEPIISNTRLIKCSENSRIELLPNTVVADKYNQEMWEALAQNAPGRTPDTTADYIVWFGISSDKRGWKEQVAGLVAIADKLTQCHPDSAILFLLDGITSSQSKVINSESDQVVAASIEYRLKDTPHSAINMIGMRYEQKISLARGANAFVCASGTPLIVPSLILRLPGVIHANDVYWDKNDVLYNPKSQYVDHSAVQKDERAEVSADYLSYSIEPDIVASMLLTQMQKYAEISYKS